MITTLNPEWRPARCPRCGSTLVRKGPLNALGQQLWYCDNPGRGHRRCGWSWHTAGQQEDERPATRPEGGIL